MQEFVDWLLLAATHNLLNRTLLTIQSLLFIFWITWRWYSQRYQYKKELDSINEMMDMEREDYKALAKKYNEENK